MITNIFFNPVFGKSMAVPFSIEISYEELFRNAISKAIQILAQKESDLLEKSYDISTNSADIMLSPEEFDLTVGKIQKKYGSAFCLRFGTIFKVQE